MNTSSRRLGGVTAVGWVRRLSPGRTGMGETRRFRTFPSSPRNGDLNQIFLSRERLKQRTEELENP